MENDVDLDPDNVCSSSVFPHSERWFRVRTTSSSLLKDAGTLSGVSGQGISVLRRLFRWIRSWNKTVFNILKDRILNLKRTKKVASGNWASPTNLHIRSHEYQCCSARTLCWGRGGSKLGDGRTYSSVQCTLYRLLSSSWLTLFPY